MYVETPPPERDDTKRLKRNSTGQFSSEGGRRGRPPKNKEGEGGKRGRKRKPSLKKRNMDSLVSTDGDLATLGGGVDIASSVKKRARMSVDSGSGVAPLGLPQCRDGADSKPFPPAPKLAPSLKNSGSKGSKKKKAPVNKETTLSQYVQPVVDVIDPLPSDGDPILARWRAAHYLYYQREDANPEDGDGAGNGKVNSVVYEGEMVDGYREGMGICLYGNDTM